jgi:hypothetical protein
VKGSQSEKGNDGYNLNVGIVRCSNFVFPQKDEIAMFDGMEMQKGLI